MSATISKLTIDQAKRVDLLHMAENRTNLHRESSGEYSGACPKCGGEDRFHCTTEWFFCRQCHEKRGDTIEFVQWLEGCDFRAAIERLTGQRAPEPAPAPQPATRLSTNNNAIWRRRAMRIADDASHRIFTDAQAEAGREYLLGRGLEPGSWDTFRLGFRYDVPLPGTWDADKRQYTIPGKPAIVMPWYRGGFITAIRYRFLETHTYADVAGKQRTEKQVAQPGSKFSGGLYGGHVLPDYTSLPVRGDKRIEGLRTLVLCEGEINAISIWQVTEPWGWDVLSLGSESQKMSQGAIDYALNFGRVLVWMDKSDVARHSTHPLTQHNGFGINSPESDGKIMDANDLLQQGLLGGFLAMVRLKACQSSDERQKLRWDLWDADQRPPYLDEGTRAVMEGITQ